MNIEFTFSQYPFPLNPNATLTFTLDAAQEISLRIYNNSGQVLHTLYDQKDLKAGHHQLQLYGRNFPDDGVYARLQTDRGVLQKQLVTLTEYLT